MDQAPPQAATDAAIPGECLMPAILSPRPHIHTLTLRILSVLLVIIAAGLAACDQGGGQTTGTIRLPPKKTLTSQATVQEFDIPSIDGLPTCLAFGKDDALWITEQLTPQYANNYSKIARLTPDGVYTTFPLPHNRSMFNPEDIALGSDGALWFTEPQADTIGRISLDGVIKEFKTPTPLSQPRGITAGPDGNLWFVESGSDNIGKITPAGAFQEYPLPVKASLPNDITVGPDGALWFTLYSGDAIGRITTAGAATIYPISSPDGKPWAITAGPDGNLWFTQSTLNAIGRITPTGEITEFPLLRAGSSPTGITKGADGNLWYTGQISNTIGRITPTGQITEFALPVPRSGPLCITPDKDGKIWFTESYGAIGYLVPKPGV
jgi:streptogramin lyase